MRIEITSGGKSPPVEITIDLWCRLCDAVGRSPESEVGEIVEAAERLSKRKTELARRR